MIVEKSLLEIIADQDEDSARRLILPWRRRNFSFKRVQASYGDQYYEARILATYWLELRLERDFVFDVDGAWFSKLGGEVLHMHSDRPPGLTEEDTTSYTRLLNKSHFVKLDGGMFPLDSKIHIVIGRVPDYTSYERGRIRNEAYIYFEAAGLMPNYDPSIIGDRRGFNLPILYYAELGKFRSMPGTSEEKVFSSQISMHIPPSHLA